MNTPRPEVFPVINGQGWCVMRIGREGSRRPLKAEAPFLFSFGALRNISCFEEALLKEKDYQRIR